MDNKKSCCLSFFSCIKRKLARHPITETLVYTFFLVIGFFILFCFLHWLELKLKGNISSTLFRNYRVFIDPFNESSSYAFDFFDNSESYSLLDFHNAYLIVLTALIAIIAWVQLKGLYSNSRADMLLRIDRLLRSENALKALVKLEEIKLIVEKEIERPKEEPYEEFKKKHEKEIEEKIGKRIKDFLQHNPIGDPKKAFIDGVDKKTKKIFEEGIYLVDFLNTIEDISYLCRKNYISNEDIKELFEHEIGYYFEIFKPYIESRRKYGSPSMYEEIERLANPKT